MAFGGAPVRSQARCLHQHHDRSERGAKSAGLYAVVDSGVPRVILSPTASTPSHRQDQRRGTAIKGCKAARSRHRGHTDGDLSNEWPADHSLLAKHGKNGPTHRRERPLFRLLGTVAAIRRRPCGQRYPRPDLGRRRARSGIPAYRQKEYQIATVAEPLHLHGWQCITS